MNLTVNGEAREFDGDALTVAGLLAQLGLGERRVAVEVNEALVRRAEHPVRALASGDRVEIVHFVGGGA
jgi:thiamine biosynthesis protein ThiS